MMIFNASPALCFQESALGVHANRLCWRPLGNNRPARARALQLLAALALAAMLSLVSCGEVQTPIAAAQPPRDRFFESDGVRIHYRDEGSGPPVVLIHGFTTNAEFWQREGVAPVLARSYRVISIDLRGHGQSEKLRDPSQYGSQMGEDVVRLLDHLRVKRVHVIGYSMGANIAVKLLATHGDRFLTVVLGGAAGIIDFKLTPSVQIGIEREARELERSSIRSILLRLWPADRPAPSEAEILDISAQALAGKDAKALAAVRRSFPALAVKSKELASVKLPVLGIVGSVDPWLAEYPLLKKAIPHMDLIVIPDGSHGSTSSSLQFRDAVVNFLGKHSAGA